jgi:hypothetical protein
MAENSVHNINHWSSKPGLAISAKKKWRKKFRRKKNGEKNGVFLENKRYV